MNEKIAVPIDSEIIGELFLRRGPKANISRWIEDVVLDYLERTADEAEWDEAYYEYRLRESGTKDFTAEYGNPKEGYYWSPLFLPNGTSVRMEYQRETYYAAIKFGKLMFKDESYSPSELARFIAVGKQGKGTSRNAWRDLLIKRPGDTEWTLADDLRKRFKV